MQTFFTHRSVSIFDRVPFQLTDELFFDRHRPHVRGETHQPTTSHRGARSRAQRRRAESRVTPRWSFARTSSCSTAEGRASRLASRETTSPCGASPRAREPTIHRSIAPGGRSKKCPSRSRNRVRRRSAVPDARSFPPSPSTASSRTASRSPKARSGRTSATRSRASKTSRR